MRRSVAAAVAIIVLGVGCGGEDPVTPGATPLPSPTGTTTSPTPSPTPLPTDRLADASCDDRAGGNADHFPDFVRVRVQRQAGVEKVEFRFEPHGRATEAPLWSARFTDQLVTDGEGRPVDAEGEAFLSISFMARGVDLSGEEFREIYTGPKLFTPGFPTVKEVVHLGDFEGLVSWGLGLGSRVCYVAEARPGRITFLFPSG